MHTSLTLYLKLTALFGLLLLVVGGSLTLYGFQRYPREQERYVPVADAARAKELMRGYGCASCHTIPGVPGAIGKVGPRLDQLKRKVYIAGILPNSPPNLVFWIQHPQQVDPQTAMPSLGVTEKDARDIAAYLYSLP